MGNTFVPCMIGRNVKSEIFEAFYSLKRLIIVHNDGLSYSGAIDTKLILHTLVFLYAHMLEHLLRYLEKHLIM